MYLSVDGMCLSPWWDPEVLWSCHMGAARGGGGGNAASDTVGSEET